MVSKARGGDPVLFAGSVEVDGQGEWRGKGRAVSVVVSDESFEGARQQLDCWLETSPTRSYQFRKDVGRFIMYPSPSLTSLQKQTLEALAAVEYVCIPLIRCPDLTALPESFAMAGLRSFKGRDDGRGFVSLVGSAEIALSFWADLPAKIASTLIESWPARTTIIFKTPVMRERRCL